MSDKIKHIGTIKSIEGNHIQVEIIQTSACSSCTVARHCNAAESKDKMIDVYDADAGSVYHIGETVNVYTFDHDGLNAVWIAFGIPFVVLLLSVFISYRIFSGNELVSAVVGLISLVICYVVLYLFRGKLNDTFAFFIEHI